MSGGQHFVDSEPLWAVFAEAENPILQQKLVFVGQLDASVERQRLLGVFGRFGASEVLFNPMGRAQNKRAAFVLFETLQGARDALELDEQRLFGTDRNPVQLARKAGVLETVPKLFVGQLPKDIADEEVVELMSQFGELAEVAVKKHLDRPAFAFVRFANLNECDEAIRELHGKPFWRSDRQQWTAPLHLRFRTSTEVETKLSTRRVDINRRACG
eukprot:NODE_5241_length_721_cov_47.651786_g4409_i0.p1 GENE.NODE_5241_length_721_cov_47.651786_g4409_i0~~NODE_5241_length_721_cov_47.651786_g4409_i0.p1  ORF type:complete len:232 (+),score=37.64 NODE_5241_length_721_cov_47.651786_g4409_i0:53-697(+)